MDAERSHPDLPSRRHGARRAVFVAIEGIDHSGKTTLTAALRDRLARDGHTVELIKEPSPGPIGALMRELSTDHACSPHALALLSAADRHQQQPRLRKLLVTVDVVIADRYYLSGLAYHLTDGVEPRFYRRCARGVLLPDLYLFLRVPVEVAAARVLRPPDSRWEQPAFSDRLPGAYGLSLDLLPADGPEVVALDATQPPDAVLEAAHTRLLARLAALLPARTSA